MSDNTVTVTKRGRPPKGERPMSASERKRDQRMRDGRAVIDAIGDEQNAPLRALLAILGRVEASDSARLSARLSGALQRNGDDRDHQAESRQLYRVSSGRSPVVPRRPESKKPNLVSWANCWFLLVELVETGGIEPPTF